MQVRPALGGLACANGFSVMRWLMSAMTSRRSAVTTTIMPRCGWTRKIASMKIGANGTSRKEISVPETRKPAQLLQIAQRLVFAARTVERGMGRGAEDRRAELRRDLDRGAHQHESPDRVEHRLQQHRAADHDRQHDQRVERAAGQHAVRDLEEIDRDRQDQDVRGQRHHHDPGQVAAHDGYALAQARIEVLGSHPAVKMRPLAATAAPSADGIARIGFPGNGARATLDGRAGAQRPPGVAGLFRFLEPVGRRQPERRFGRRRGFRLPHDVVVRKVLQVMTPWSFRRFRRERIASRRHGSTHRSLRWAPPRR